MEKGVSESLSPGRKRIKLDKAAVPPQINAGLLLPESKAAVRQAVETSTPYKHCVLKDVFDVELLKNVREEIIHNIQATYKETDLFRVFQTGDLANLDDLDESSSKKLPSLLALKDAIYSPAFRQLVCEVTGCGPLSPRTDCSCNVYARGCHLLCHDDVIGTRRVSYIIYLTDPDDPWTTEDGGALELYPLDQGEPPLPHPVPTVFHLPTWNTMAMFVVQPGRSFHSVEEVFNEDKPRMSISGWYHAEDAPEDAAMASLQQLQMVPGVDNITHYNPFVGDQDTAGPLTDQDRQYLSRYVNETYLQEEVWPKIREQFKKDGSTQLQMFLKPELASQLLSLALADDARDQLGRGQRPRHSVGVGSGWQHGGPPHKQRYLRYQAASSDVPVTDGAVASMSCGQMMDTLKQDLFCSAAFARLLKEFTTITLLGQQSEVRRFRPGLDYTVAHYGVLTKDPRLDCVLCVVDDGSQDSKEAWDSGEVGGFEAYLLAEEDKAGATDEEVYRQDTDESGVLNVSAAHNSLNLVLRDEGLMKFVKYVSFLAPSSRWDIAVEYQPEDDDDDEEGDGDGDGAADC